MNRARFSKLFEALIGVALTFFGIDSRSSAEDRTTMSSRVISPTDDSVRAAVAKSLPFLEREGTAWMADRGCMSCHHVPFLVWAHRSAAARGFDVDRKKMAEWDEWCRQDSLAHRNLYRLQNYDLGKVEATRLPDAMKEKLKPLVEVPFRTEDDFVAKLKPLMTDDEFTAYGQVILKTAERSKNNPDRTGGGLDVVGQLLIGSHGSESSLASSEFRNGAIELLKQNQLADGSWIPGNQFSTMRRWPTSAANQSTSMWTALALHSYGDNTRDPSNEDATSKLIELLKHDTPAPDNREWLATRLLFASKFGSADETTSFHTMLLEARNQDGGWSWEKSLPSDPFTTGLALYVLSRIGSESDATVKSLACHYLLHSQHSDGSWPTAAKNFTKSTDPERLKARDEIYHYWGTAWAAIGLMETLKPAPR